MKNIFNIGFRAALLLALVACEQEVLDLKNPEVISPSPACPPNSMSGSADLSKFIAIGNSFVAGVQGGALFTEGQNTSLPAILNKQFECAGGPSTFVQPSINSTLGWNLFAQPFLLDNTQPIQGRMLLQYGDNKDCTTGAPAPRPTPQKFALGNFEALPNPQANPGFIYTGERPLNNFGVPVLTIGQLLTPATGNWGDPDQAKGFNPFYARFASQPGASTIITDAAAAGGTFFLFWAGMDDFLLYAAFGGDPTRAPLTSPADFGFRYGAALSPASPIGLLGLNPQIKGVVANFPDIWKMPHFTSISYNPVPLEAANASALTTGFAGYNLALTGLVANKAAFGISDELAAEIETRKLTFTAGCNNSILLVDETLTDLGAFFDILQSVGAINATQRAALAPYEQVRQSTPADIIPLSTGTVLGQPGTFGIRGVSEPLGDLFVIIPSEKAEIDAARTAYNSIVSQIAAAFPDRLALADVEAGLGAFTGPRVEDGVLITPNINPPTGIYSEDGLHPNSRGYAFLADIFINAINAKFGATIPSVNLANYQATGLPIP